MELQNVLNYVIIPLGVSFLSSFLIWCFSQLFSIGARNKINHLLIIMRDECIAFEKYLKYSDYDNALTMTRRIIDKVSEVYITKKPLTYLCPQKRRLFNLLLNNIYYICHKFTQQEIGYHDNKEKVACCERMYREVFVIGYKQDPKSTSFLDPINFDPITSCSAKILIDLNLSYTKSIENILSNGDFFNGHIQDVEILKKYYEDLIDIKLYKNSISSEIAKKFILTNYTLTEKKYLSILNKMKSKGQK